MNVGVLFFTISTFADHSVGIGIVEKTGSACSQLRVGVRVGWGPVNSTCATCDIYVLKGKDAYCPDARTYGAEGYDTQGSICSYAVRKEWLFKIPDSISSIYAAP